METETEFSTKCRNDAYLNLALNQGNSAGYTYVETLEKFIVHLLDIKDECFQQKLEQIMNSPAPFIQPKKD